jgi:hypothetical protein
MDAALGGKTDQAPSAFTIHRGRYYIHRIVERPGEARERRSRLAIRLAVIFVVQLYSVWQTRSVVRSVASFCTLFCTRLPA